MEKYCWEGLKVLMMLRAIDWQTRGIGRADKKVPIFSVLWM